MLALIRSAARLGVVSSIFAAGIAYALHPECVRYCIAAGVLCSWAWVAVRIGWRSEVERKYAALFAHQGERIKLLGEALEKAGIHKPFVPPTLDLKIGVPAVDKVVAADAEHARAAENWGKVVGPQGVTNG